MILKCGLIDDLGDVRLDASVVFLLSFVIHCAGIVYEISTIKCEELRIGIDFAHKCWILEPISTSKNKRCLGVAGMGLLCE